MHKAAAQNPPAPKSLRKQWVLGFPGFFERADGKRRARGAFLQVFGKCAAQPDAIFRKMHKVPPGPPGMTERCTQCVLGLPQACWCTTPRVLTHSRALHQHGTFGDMPSYREKSIMLMASQKTRNTPMRKVHSPGVGGPVCFCAFWATRLACVAIW